MTKKGNAYTFAYKTTASGNWINLITKTWNTTPTHVGMIIRTWTATAVKADFDYFTLVSEIRQDLEYTYDTVGNITSIYDRLVPETLTYKYDDLYRLTGVSGGLSESYEYNTNTGNLNSKTGMGTYGYNDGDHEHAVTHLSDVQKYWYNANGNMTKRIANGLTYYLNYDAENRLVGVSGAATATFTYDGDSNRVKSVEGGVTTVYIGSYYEWTSAGSTRYYYAGGQRVAMRREGYSSYNGLYYLVSDHLGSTSLVLNSSGTIVQQTKYKPWGEIRSGSITLTDFGFTGQRTDSYINLMWYNSRHYDPSLGRFSQPDSIIPNPGDPASWNRYQYVRNSPLVYRDPSGHAECKPGEPDCPPLKPPQNPPPQPPQNPPIPPTSSPVSIDEENGLCIDGLGCSGIWDDFTQSVKKVPDRVYWDITHPIEASGIDIAEIADYSGGLLNLGLNGYENWRGIPLPKSYGFGVDFAVQLVEDAPRNDLNVLQRLGRASFASFEGMIVSGLSGASGVIIGDAALTASFTPAVTTQQLWLPPVAYWTGYAVTYLAVNYSLGNLADRINSVIFPSLGLGIP